MAADIRVPGTNVLFEMRRESARGALRVGRRVRGVRRPAERASGRHRLCGPIPGAQEDEAHQEEVRVLGREQPNPKIQPPQEKLPQLPQEAPPSQARDGVPLLLKPSLLQPGAISHFQLSWP